MTDLPCQLIIDDLLLNRHWTSALQISLFDKPVVLARELRDSSLVVFVPVEGDVLSSDLTLYVERVRQLAVDISTGEVTVESSKFDSSVGDDCRRESNENLCSDSSEPDILESTSGTCRFVEDVSFDRDKCLRLHQEVQEQQFRFEIKREEEDRKRARTEEIRLGLIPPDEIMETSAIDFSSNPQPPTNSTVGTSSENFCPDPTIDFYTSVMFAFHDSGTLSYFMAASGLAPPQFCPEDSDDEKPFDIVQQELKQAEKKRKNVES